MHDPDVVVFDLYLPIPCLNGWDKTKTPRWGLKRKTFTNSQHLGQPIGPWSSLDSWIVMLGGRRISLYKLGYLWHHEPDDRDSGTVCKGNRGSRFSSHSIKWAAKHFKHLSVQVFLLQDIKRWRSLKCHHCGTGFYWKEQSTGYMYNKERYHFECMEVVQLKFKVKDYESYLDGTADANAKWRVEYAQQRRATMTS